MTPVQIAAIQANAPLIAILLPLAAGALMLAIGRRATPLVPLATAAVQVAAAGLIVAAVAQDGAFRIALGAWNRPLGITLYVDRLSALFLAVAALVASAIVVYALPDQRHAGRRERRGPYAFWALFLFLWGGLAAVFLSGDLFNLYVVLELTSLAAIGLVALDGDATALRAQMRYLLFAAAGGLLYLFGVALLYAQTGVLDLMLAAAAIERSPPVIAAAVLMTLGMFVKAAVWPLHFWLPQAHGSAPPAVSAALSALVVKAALFLLLRLWFDLFAPVLPEAAWLLPGILGAGAVLWGSVLAFRQDRLKLMIAHSTVAQLGYMLFVFPLAPSGGAVAAGAWAGAMLQIVGHAVAKAAMFLAAGALVRGMGGDDRDSLRGAAWRAPVPVFALGLAGLSVIALPPSGGFLAKWMLLRAAFQAEMWWLAAVIVVGGLLAAAYLFRFLVPAFDEPAGDRPGGGAVSPWLSLSALFLALVSVALGFVAAPILAFVGDGPGDGAGVGQ